MRKYLLVGAAVLAIMFLFAFVSIISIAVIAVAVAWPTVPDEPDPQPEPEPAFVAPADPQLRSAAEQLAAVVRGHPRAEDVAYVYARLARSIADPEIKTTEQVRAIHEYTGSELVRAMPGIQVLDEQARAEQLVSEHVGGLENTVIDEAKRRKLVEAFDAIAWACWTARPKLVAKFKPDQLRGLIDSRGDLDRIDAVNNGLPVFGQRGPNPAEGLTDDQLAIPPPMGLIEPSKEEREEFLGSVPKFGDLGLPSGRGKTRLLYAALELHDPGCYSERQTAADCVSHAARNAVDTARAFAITVSGDHQRFWRRGATEPIYAARGSGRDAGMTIYRAAKWINEGGYAVRAKYDATDLSRYDGRKAIRWGATGIPRPLREVLREHLVLKITSIRSVEDARDAIASGFPLFVGSNVGFSSRRDRYGFSQPRGTWYHAMAWIATAPLSALTDDSVSDEPCFLIQNSWGTWNGGPKGKFEIPDGSFWVRADVAARMIAQDQAVAVGDFTGFKPTPLPDWGFRIFAKELLNVRVASAVYSPTGLGGYRRDRKSSSGRAALSADRPDDTRRKRHGPVTQAKVSLRRNGQSEAARRASDRVSVRGQLRLQANGIASTQASTQASQAMDSEDQRRISGTGSQASGRRSDCDAEWSTLATAC